MKLRLAGSRSTIWNKILQNIEIAKMKVFFPKITLWASGGLKCGLRNLQGFAALRVINANVRVYLLVLHIMGFKMICLFETRLTL